MLKIASVVAVTGVVLAGLFSPAVATTTNSPRAVDRVIYRDVGFDPEDVQNEPDFDIRRSTRTVLRKDGVRYLRVVVRGQSKYAEYNPEALVIEARLNTRGNTKFDYRLALITGERGSYQPPQCYVTARRASKIVTFGSLKFRDSGAMACRVKLAKMTITHRVHWYLDSYSGIVPGWVPAIDRAPDMGWYS